MMVILFVCFQSKNARYQILCMIAFFVNLNYKPFKLLASCFFISPFYQLLYSFY